MLPLKNNIKREVIPGILLVYHRPLLIQDAATVSEHIEAFKKYSKFRLLAINTAYGFPPKLNNYEFKVIVLHYSLFGYPYNQYLEEGFFEYFESLKASYKIAFFQDEHHFCKPRFSFINHYEIDCVYTLLEPENWSKTYRRYTNVDKLVYNIPGYVSENLLEKADKFNRHDENREIDIFYRGRNLKFYMGKGAREKYDIGKSFLEKAHGSDLKLDIEVEEGSRIYGDSWYEYLGNSKGCLGVEAGVSIFDLEDIVRKECDNIIDKKSDIGFQELSDKVLCKFEDNIYYRTISPRHFEAAAFKICQILFEGRYSGIMLPMLHYLPLKKDFSNFDKIITLFKDKNIRRDLTENAHRDLIKSGRFSYKSFIEKFCNELIKENIDLDIKIQNDSKMVMIENQLKENKLIFYPKKVVQKISMPTELFALLYSIYIKIPGTRALNIIIKPIYNFVKNNYLRIKSHNVNR